MDLRSYYKKVREAEASLNGEHFVVVSLDTPEGGKAGVRTEVTRPIAARLIAETRARLATEEEAEAFHEAQRAAKATHEQEQAANRVQVMVIPAHEVKKQAKERS
jgi:molybdenum-dependent DNA-binding transcriptional regulator ModE